MSDNVVISVKNLKTYFYTNERCNRAINGVSMDIKSGKTLCIVGESGCGKSVTATSIMQLLPKLSRIEEGEIIYHSGDERGDIRIHELERSSKEMRALRGRDIAMIFQDPMTALNPVYTIGWQISEMIRSHDKSVSKAEARERALKLLTDMGIPNPQKRIDQYPHEFSGGMRQRVMIAMALANKPELLIADEPTTALDVTIQDQILRQLRELEKEYGTSIIFITHDLGVVAELCDRVIVMYGGLVMEEAPIDEIFEHPSHPYTMGLLNSIPDMEQDKAVRLKPIPGSPPDMTNPPAGCPFAPRCPYARKLCGAKLPEFIRVEEGHSSRCFLLYPDAPADENNPFRREV